MHHEKYFTPDLLHASRPLAAPQASECSWLAAPFAGELMKQGVQLIHLVRHPLAVIASLAARRLWTAPRRYTEYARHFADIPSDMTEHEQSMCYWVLWNRPLSALNVPRIRIESIDNAPRLHRNRLKTSLRLAWDDLPDTKWRGAAKALAEVYGYRGEPA